MNEDAVVTAKSAAKTIYLVTEGLEAEIESIAKSMIAQNLPTEAAIIRGTLKHRVEAIDFLTGIIMDALEGALEQENDNEE